LSDRQSGIQLNCSEFRRHLLADARRLGAEALRHQKTCAACAEFFARLACIKSELTTAACVRVPEGLADRVLLNHELGKARAQNWFARLPQVWRWRRPGRSDYLDPAA